MAEKRKRPSKSKAEPAPQPRRRPPTEVTLPVIKKVHPLGFDPGPVREGLPRT